MPRGNARFPGAGGGVSVRYLALGDSYTIGEGVGQAERWPVQLARLLEEAGRRVEGPEIVAATGWTTAELLAGIAAAAPRGQFDLVSLLIGVNNQYRGLDPREYHVELGTLLARATGLAGGSAGRVLVLSTPDWSVTPFADGRDRDQIAAEIDRFNEIGRQASARLGARYVDVTPASRHAAADRTFLAADGLHPSGRMYAEWAQLALPEAIAALGA